MSQILLPLLSLMSKSSPLDPFTRSNSASLDLRSLVQWADVPLPDGGERLKRLRAAVAIVAVGERVFVHRRGRLGSARCHRRGGVHRFRREHGVHARRRPLGRHSHGGRHSGIRGHYRGRSAHSRHWGVRHRWHRWNRRRADARPRLHSTWADFDQLAEIVLRQLAGAARIDLPLLGQLFGHLHQLRVLLQQLESLGDVAWIVLLILQQPFDLVLERVVLAVAPLSEPGKGRLDLLRGQVAAPDVM